LRQLAETARAQRRNLVLGDQRGDVRQAESGGQLLVDPGGGRIECGVGTVHGDAGAGDLQQQSFRRAVGRQAFQGPEGQRMVRDDQVGALSNGLAGAVGSHRQASHHALDAVVQISDQ
jgi:hypothetical protein